MAKTRKLPIEIGEATEEDVQRIYRWVLIGASAVIGTLLLIFVIQWSLTADVAIPQLGGTSIILLIAAIVLIAAGMAWGPRPKIAAFAAITILLFYVIYAYRSGELEIGYNRPLLYLIAVVVSAFVATQLTGAPFRETLTASLLVLAVWSLLGLSHLYTWEQLRGTEQVFSRSVRCDLVKREVDFHTDRWTNINQGGACNPAGLWHDGHCLWLKRAAWTGDKAVYGKHCSGALPKDVEWAMSADTPFTGAVSLGPPKYN